MDIQPNFFLPQSCEIISLMGIIMNNKPLGSLGAGEDEQLSKYFMLSDLIKTSQGTANFPDDAALANLRLLAPTLDLIIDNIGPITVTSAYRSQATQDAIKAGGAGATSAKIAVTTSYHSLGLAADIKPTTMSLEQFYVKLINSDVLKPKLGQIAYVGEEGIIHVSIPTDKFPSATPMQEDETTGGYVRLTSDEIADWTSKYPVAAIAAGGAGILIAGAIAYLAYKYLSSHGGLKGLAGASA